MLSTKLLGGVLSLLPRIYPNMSASVLSYSVPPRRILCCLVSLSTLWIVSSDIARLALKASIVFLNADVDEGMGFTGVLDPQLLFQKQKEQQYAQLLSIDLF